MENRMADKVKDIVSQYSAQIKDSKIFFAPNIPENKLSNAVQSYAAVGNDEEHLALVDNTSLGSAKEGLLLTNRRIYSRGSDGKQHSFALQEIQSITFKPSWLAGALTKVSVNDTLLLGGIIPSNTAMEQFCQMLRDITANVGAGIVTELPIEAVKSPGQALKQGKTKEPVQKPSHPLKIHTRRINIYLSFILAGIVFALYVNLQQVVTGILLAYVYWSWWWGLQLLWPMYKSSAKYEGSAPDAFLMRLWTPIFYFPIYLCLAGVVGIFGGGIYKFIKYVRKKGPTP